MSAVEPALEPSAGPAAEGFFLGPDEGDPFFWLGTLTINKLEGHSTRGGMDIVDHRVPAGYAPPLHVHRAQDEVFYVLEGLFTFHCGDRSWQAAPGSLGFLPRNVPHGYSVSADGPGRTLLINAPAGFAEVISELGEHASELVIPGPEVAMPDPDRIRAVSEAHGIFGAPGH
jgi:mannose-6-phosphate isomerase-like protein (cupin superfamily)